MTAATDLTEFRRCVTADRWAFAALLIELLTWRHS